ncbi:MAG: 4Fe-4S dicluster domain-containing protein, partial [Planctomycetota bacterium]|nr:4Fe-4S dicluster domain-containing protein [Planctomycetota bacterium]
KTVLDAIRKAGVDVPTLCYHKDLTGYGSCRLCQVEVTQKGRTRLVVSCLYPVAEGLEVKTHTERVEKNRRLLVELLSARSPDSKVLQKMAKEYKIEKPHFRLKSEKCILCGLCVRVCSEILGANAIGFAGRGTSKKIEVPFKEAPEDCLGCGACTYVCPTGAIQMESEARKRWALYLSSGDRECRYSRMGLISHKVCPNAFQCQRCEVDQRLEETLGTHPAFVAKPFSKLQPIRIDQFQIQPNRYYTAAHIWVKPLNGKFRVGVDDFTAKFVGRIDNIKAERAFSNNKPICELVIADRILPMYMPFSGEVVEINRLTRSVPSLSVNDPYQQGWLFSIKADNREQALERLLSPLKATALVKQHSEKLHQRLSKELGITMTDGAGNLVNNIPALLKEEEWNTLTREFFKPMV